MAAFCACCGAEITKKSESCPVCGTPTHGMLPAGDLSTLEIEGETSQSREPGFRSRRCEVHNTRSASH